MHSLCFGGIDIIALSPGMAQASVSKIREKRELSQIADSFNPAQITHSSVAVFADALYMRSTEESTNFLLHS